MVDLLTEAGSRQPRVHNSGDKIIVSNAAARLRASSAAMRSGRSCHADCLMRGSVAATTDFPVREPFDVGELYL